MNPNPLPIPPAHPALEEKIREAAYFEWLERGSTHGDDWAHWFAAENRILAKADLSPVAHVEPVGIRPKPSIQGTLNAHASDPTHRYHGPGTARDDRTNVIAGEARQRIRGRHFDSSLRPQQKPATQSPPSPAGGRR